MQQPSGPFRGDNPRGVNLLLLAGGKIPGVNYRLFLRMSPLFRSRISRLLKEKLLPKVKREHQYCHLRVERDPTSCVIFIGIV